MKINTIYLSSYHWLTDERSTFFITTLNGKNYKLFPWLILILKDTNHFSVSITMCIFLSWLNITLNHKLLKHWTFAWNVLANNRRQKRKLPVSLPTILNYRDFLNNRTTQVSESNFLRCCERSYSKIHLAIAWPLSRKENKSSSRVRLRCPEGAHCRDISCLSWHGLFAFHHCLLNGYILCCMSLEFYLFLVFFIKSLFSSFTKDF